MSDSTFEPVDPITARNQYAALYRGSTPPEPQVEQAARRKMVTARIDKAIRDAFDAYPVPLHPAQVEYLTGLIANGGRQK
ncbi:hypothetical protein [Nocardioides sp.]|uniref:hypothetical protein n=1 Tax=Nocardioides sp. TaxID=35761 RepID=UPI0026104390|nr:hypothetical protein [Nocardioides sp.]MCW2738876.1 hypothetical protein [Nocardioides sp.]